jgi:hypothetical protein
MKPVDLTPRKLMERALQVLGIFFRNGSFLVEELVAKAK